MPSCMMRYCKNYTVRCKKNSGISFHRFPSDPSICDRWMGVVRVSRGESRWKPKKTDVICSAHFNESDFYLTKLNFKRLVKTAVPFLSNKSSTSIGEESGPAAVVIESPIEDISDVNSACDSPHIIKIKDELSKLKSIQTRHVRVIKTLRQKNHRLKKARGNLKTIVKFLKKQHNINKHIHNVLSNNLVAANLFNNMYLKDKNEKKEEPKYNPEFKKFCLTLHFYSPCAYKYVRYKFNTCLPHSKTVEKWYRNINGAPGFIEEVFDDDDDAPDIDDEEFDDDPLGVIINEAFDDVNGLSGGIKDTFDDDFEHLQFLSV